jgi:hypothetical protein
LQPKEIQAGSLQAVALAGLAMEVLEEVRQVLVAEPLVVLEVV